VRGQACPASGNIGGAQAQRARFLGRSRDGPGLSRAGPFARKTFGWPGRRGGEFLFSNRARANFSSPWGSGAGKFLATGGLEGRTARRLPSARAILGTKAARGAGQGGQIGEVRGIGGRAGGGRGGRGRPWAGKAGQGQRRRGGVLARRARPLASRRALGARGDGRPRGRGARRERRDGGKLMAAGGSRTGARVRGEGAAASKSGLVGRRGFLVGEAARTAGGQARGSGVAGGAVGDGECRGKKPRP